MLVKEGGTALQEVLHLFGKRNVLGSSLRSKLGTSLASFVVIPSHEDGVLL
jgi:hypothetical protein